MILNKCTWEKDFNFLLKLDFMGSYWVSRDHMNGEIHWKLKEIGKGEYIAYIIDRPFRRHFVVKITELGNDVTYMTKSDEFGILLHEGRLIKGCPFEDKDGYRYAYKDKEFSY